MLIAPVIFCTVVIGIAGMEDMKKVGKVGGLALLYFEAVTTLALFVGLFLVNILQPGAGMHVDPATLDMNSVSMYATAEKPQSTLDFLFHIIPSSVVGAFAQGDILQVLFFSIMLVMDLASLMKRSTPRISAKPATGMSPTAERVAANTINPDPETPAAPLLVKRRTVNSVAC